MFLNVLLKCPLWFWNSSIFMRLGASLLPKCRKTDSIPRTFEGCIAIFKSTSGKKKKFTEEKKPYWDPQKTLLKSGVRFDLGSLHLRPSVHVPLIYIATFFSSLLQIYYYNSGWRCKFRAGSATRPSSRRFGGCGGRSAFDRNVVVGQSFQRHFFIADVTTRKMIEVSSRNRSWPAWRAADLTTLSPVRLRCASSPALSRPTVDRVNRRTRTKFWNF